NCRHNIFCIGDVQSPSAVFPAKKPAGFKLSVADPGVRFLPMLCEIKRLIVSLLPLFLLYASDADHFYLGKLSSNCCRSEIYLTST
ncbi:MAG TPA: hypothetical protein VFR24_07650, partial [Candidatus Angelobacter sp.]|nr:hypothetical protein [Candidatus Angelobacter sp.]